MKRNSQESGAESPLDLSTLPVLPAEIRYKVAKRFGKSPSYIGIVYRNPKYKSDLHNKIRLHAVKQIKMYWRRKELREAAANTKLVGILEEDRGRRD